MGRNPDLDKSKKPLRQAPKEEEKPTAEDLDIPYAQCVEYLPTFTPKMAQM